MDVSDFEQFGIQLFVTEEGGLRYSAQKGVLNKEVLRLLSENKPALIEELLRQEPLLREKVTDVTDQPKLVTDVSGRNQTKSDGSDGCDGFGTDLHRGKTYTPYKRGIPFSL